MFVVGRICWFSSEGGVIYTAWEMWMHAWVRDEGLWLDYNGWQGGTTFTGLTSLASFMLFIFLPPALVFLGRSFYRLCAA